MKFKISAIILIFAAIASGWWWKTKDEPQSGAPPYGEEESDAPEMDRFAWLNNWKRPEGPPKVGLQVGHWKNEELPEELSRLRGSTGATGGGKSEWEVTLAIAENTAEILRAKGVMVDILPATVPSGYWADLFVALHADGSKDRSKSGYKIARSWRDISGKADELADFLDTSYQQATGLDRDPNVTRNMRGYYAFAWWRYEHAVHPMTAAVIVETGFLTNAADRQLLISRPQIPAGALARGMFTFLRSEGLIKD